MINFSEILQNSQISLEHAECLGITTLTRNFLFLVSLNKTFNIISVKVLELKILKQL